VPVLNDGTAGEMTSHSGRHATLFEHMETMRVLKGIDPPRLARIPDCPPPAGEVRRHLCSVHLAPGLFGALNQDA